MRKPFIVAYDVADPRRLRNIRHAVTEFAHGGQKSVWECWADKPKESVDALQRHLDPRADRLALFRPVFHQTRIIGSGKLSSDRPIIFIG